MHQGKLVFAQLNEHLPRAVFAQCVTRYAPRYPALSFSCWDQLLCMTFAQLAAKSSLRDITTCLRSQAAKLYHAGIRGTVARSTLADANEMRDCRIFEDFALHLIGLARQLYANDTLAMQLRESVYAIDSTTIDLCLSLFSWAPAAKQRAGVKLHTLLDLRGNIPTVVRVTDTFTSDVSFLDHLHLEAGSFYVMDRGYIHFARLIRFCHAGAFFVIRSRTKMLYHVLLDELADEANGIRSDQHIVTSGQDSTAAYPVPLRRIEFLDPERQLTLIFLTNNFSLQAHQIAALYKSRWQVELFFKWIKQHLRIKRFVGTSPNAVKIQVWTAIATYVLVTIVKKRLNSNASMHTLMQVLSVNLFERTPLDALICNISPDAEMDSEMAQLGLF
jgi:transposase